MGRPVELLLELFLIAGSLGMFHNGLRQKGKFICGSMFALLLIHIVVEGPRLPMALVYAMAIMVGISYVCASNRRAVVRIEKNRNQGLRRTCRGLLVIGSSMAIVIPVAFPVFKMPRPTGPYAVGRTTWYLTDKSRGETYTANPNDSRELAAHIFYPAVVGPENERADYTSYPLDDFPSSSSWLLKLLLKHLSMPKSWHYRNVQVASNNMKYPVLLFSHGNGSKTECYSALLEEAASRGYIVIGIDHTYDCAFSVLPNGRWVFRKNTEGEQALSEGERKRLKQLSERLFNNTKEIDPVEYETIWGELFQKSTMAKKVGLWVRDIRFVLNRLERIDAGDDNTRFCGQMDLQRVGVLGMSLGGASAVQFCSEDDRCKAVINLDGSPFGDLLASGRSLQMPSLFFMGKNIYIGKPLPESVRSREILFQRFTRKTYRVKIDQSTHLSFSDIPLWSPVFAFIFDGGFSGERITRIINNYTMAFFDHHLKGALAPLLSGPSEEYPEVELSIRN